MKQYTKGIDQITKRSGPFIFLCEYGRVNKSMDIEKAKAIIQEAEKENDPHNIEETENNQTGSNETITDNQEATNNTETTDNRPLTGEEIRLNNLVKIKTLSKEEARKRGRNGGIKSGETRRKRKTARELLDKMLQANLTNDQIDEILGNASNILQGDQTVYNVMLAKMVQQSMAGDYRAFTVLRDTAGEKPIEQSVTLTDSMSDEDRKQIDKMRKQLMDISKIV